MTLFEYIDANIPDFIETLVRICEIPAPTFQEEPRGIYFALLFERLGFTPEIHSSGNVIVPITNAGSPHVVLSAHLDTVFDFPQINVERSNLMLRAPGISDDSAGLAALHFICSAFKATGFPDRGSLTLLATVGEEGLGNLRGSRAFFETTKRPVDYFISLDGSDAERIVTVGLASKRIRIRIQGPGGHSWGDAGAPNPIHLSGEILSRINRLLLPAQPKTTINVGIIHGGTSINAIPAELHMDVDLRSESSESLLWLEHFLQSSVNEIVKDTAGVSSEIQILGERPSGAIHKNHILVKLALEANARFGLQAQLETGSTDSNIPFALGIPALTMGVGGKGGKIHTPEEWYDVAGVEQGLKRTAMLVHQLMMRGNCE